MTIDASKLEFREIGTYSKKVENGGIAGDEENMDTTINVVTLRLTPTRQRYAELDKRYAELRPFFDELKAAKAAVINECGTDEFFQDSDGIVYYTAEKKGQWIDFTPYEILRTRRPGEKKGSLSLMVAKDAGFEVE